ncbi:MAG: hypothetical protein GF401_07900 [Chitinivibrionales bacterium]|nr:hypothetical protein [Chitinivibrionales bacterium]
MKIWNKLEIEKLVYGGWGLARTDQGIVFVSDVIPGETVRAQQIGVRSDCPIAQPVEIIEPSPNRRNPVCACAQECGGCDWQHIAHPVQLTIKKKVFLECLERTGKLHDLPPVQIFSAHEWNYRLRVQFKVEPARGKKGFYKKGTNEIVDIPACRLLAAPLNDFFADLDLHLASLPESTAEIKAVCGSDGVVASYPAVNGTVMKKALIDVAGSRLSVSGTSFFQSNRHLLEPLGKWAGPWLEGDTFVDLYGGGGFFSVMLGDAFKKGLCIDNEIECIDLAKENLYNNNLPHVETRLVSAENFLLNPSIKDIDCLIVDPPRPGLTRNAREGISALNPNQILYVSCNPSTQARDIGYFVNKMGYTIYKAALFDLYPQTHHMETAIILNKGALRMG